MEDHSISSLPARGPAPKSCRRLARQHVDPLPPLAALPMFRVGEFFSLTVDFFRKSRAFKGRYDFTVHVALSSMARSTDGTARAFREDVCEVADIAGSTVSRSLTR